MTGTRFYPLCSKAFEGLQLFASRLTLTEMDGRVPGLCRPCCDTQNELISNIIVLKVGKNMQKIKRLRGAHDRNILEWVSEMTSSVVVSITNNKIPEHMSIIYVETYIKVCMFVCAGTYSRTLNIAYVVHLEIKIMNMYVWFTQPLAQWWVALR